MSERDIIPLFPLGKILFPKMVLPLHIFEDRYKEMISKCLDQESAFGLLLNDPAEINSVGTTAIVKKVTKTYSDGRMDILVQGVSRFRVHEIFTFESYDQAEIVFIADDSTVSPAVDQINKMLSLYHRFISRLGLDEEQKKLLIELVEDIDEERDLSYVIGQTIGLDPPGQQDLLSETSPALRIKLLTEELSRHQSLYKVAKDVFEGTDFDPMSN